MPAPTVPPPCTHTPLIPAQTQHKPGRAGLIGRPRGLSSSQRRISPDLGLETQFHFIRHASASAHNRAKPVTCQVGFAARSPDGAAQAPTAPLHPWGGGHVQEPPPGNPSDPPLPPPGVPAQLAAPGLPRVQTSSQFACPVRRKTACWRCVHAKASRPAAAHQAGTLGYFRGVFRS